MPAAPTEHPDATAVLATLHPAVRAWFEEQFPAPTEVQVRGWHHALQGGNVLLGAPTGSGKTLAAFLVFLSQLVSEQLPDKEERLRLVYVSPLRALNYDIERNLRAPLAGIRRHAERLGLSIPELRVGVRTGDTPQSERARQRKNPPDILITTPESLYVMLTSATRELFDHVRWLILDEIHALAASKRGTHLALTLERLDQRLEQPLQRVGLSATQRPIERIAAFLGGCGDGRDVTWIEAARDKQWDLQVRVPVQDMTAAGRPIPLVAGSLDDLDSPTSNAAPEVATIWTAMYAELLDQVAAHRSTICFVNSRRLAERLAASLNELAEQRDLTQRAHAQRAAIEADGGTWGEDTPLELPEGWAPPQVARAHHGSIARAARTEMEELLKAGNLPCIVATSSLELGIDMGAVDLVLQIESPRSVAAGIQRVGRAGHHVGDISVGRVYPKHRADLVEAAAVVRMMAEGDIEPVHIPELCLDVLAQQIVAICAERDYTVTELHELALRAWPYRDLSRAQLDNLLALLSGALPMDELADLRARIIWNRDDDTVRTRDDAARIALTNGGTIPDRGLFGVFVAGGGSSRVGELDEEMVHETRLGDVIVLGSTSWRVEEITRDRVLVTPQPGAIGKTPFWHGEGMGRTLQLGEAVGALLRRVADELPDAEGETAELERALMHDQLLDENAACNLVTFVADQVAAAGSVPTDRTIVIERFRDELGDWRICILSPWGKPVHGPWAMAIEERLAREYDLEATALWSDDGIALRVPDSDIELPTSVLLPDADEVEDLVVQQLGGSALFASRFREIVTRSLLVTLGGPRQRSPLWLQRLRAADVLRAAQGHASFPMLLETYREILRDVFAVPALRDLLRRISQGAVNVTDITTRHASPFATSLLFDYSASFIYDADQPAAERRAQALAIDQALLRELLGSDELRELLDPRALDQVHDELQGLLDERGIASADALHDLLRSLGDLGGDEIAARTREGHDAAAFMTQLIDERRIARIRIGSDVRLIAAEDVGSYVDALGVAPPRGVPATFLHGGDAPLRRLVARFARTNIPFRSDDLAQRWGAAPAAIEVELSELESAGTVLRGGFLPGGSTPEWCDPEVLRRIRRRSLALLRREIEPIDPPALTRFLGSWHSLGAPAQGSVDTAREVIVQLEGVEATPDMWEHDLIAPRLTRWNAAWIDELVKTGQVTWMGRGTRHGAIVVSLMLREHFELLAPDPDELPDDDDCRAVIEALDARGASFMSEVTTATGLTLAKVQSALWRLAAAGWCTNDAWSTLAGAKIGDSPAVVAPVVSGMGESVRHVRSGRRAALRRMRRGAAGGRRSGGIDPQAHGRWSRLSEARGTHDERVSALADALLDTFGVVTRQVVQMRPVPGGFASIYRALSRQEEIGAVRRGWFVEGLGGAQFALPEAVDRLRAVRSATGDGAPTFVLRATDPAQPFGGIVTWPIHPDDSIAAPRRDASLLVVIRDGELLATVSTAGRKLTSWNHTLLPDVARALARAVRDRRLPRLLLESIDGNPIDAETVAAFAGTGFVRTPRGIRATPSTVSEATATRSGRPARRTLGDAARPTHGRYPNEPQP